MKENIYRSLNQPSILFMFVQEQIITFKMKTNISTGFRSISFVTSSNFFVTSYDLW